MALVPAVSSQSIWKFSPQTIPGCQLWLDGADAGSITTGSTFTWRDKSGNGNNATQSTAANQPTYSSVTNSLTFTNASNTSLNTSYTPAGGAQTIFAVVTPTSNVVTASNVAFTITSTSGTSINIGSRTNISSNLVGQIVQFTGLSPSNLELSNGVNYFVTGDNWTTGTTSRISLSTTLNGTNITTTGNITGTGLMFMSYFVITSSSATSIAIGSRTNTTSKLTGTIVVLPTLVTAGGLVAAKTYYVLSDDWTSGTTSNITLTFDPTGSTGPFSTTASASTTLQCTSINTYNILGSTASSGIGLTLSIYTGRLILTGSTGGSNPTIGITSSLAFSSSLISFDMLYNSNAVGFIFFYFNGNTASVININSPFASATSIIGSQNTSVPFGFDGTISEIICYNSGLPLNQRQQVEAYLTWKWGLQANLPTTHPFKQSLGIIPFSRGFTVTDIPGCQLWLDASDSTTITLSGSNVTGWADKSGNANNAIAFSNPTLTSINSVQAMSLNNGPYFTGPISITAKTLTCFAVAVNTTTATSHDMRLVSLATPTTTDNGQGNAGVIAIFISGNTTTLLTYRQTTSLSSYVNSLTIPFQAVSVYNGATAFLWKNGANSNSGNSNAVFGITSYGIGNQAKPSGEFWTGSIGEIIVYDTGLSAPQRQQVEGYLALKWGLQSYLPGTHPFKSNNPYSGTPFNPLILTPNAWFDTVDSYSVILSGTNVTNWNDKSTNGLNLSSSSSYPTYSTTVSKNGLPTINFSSSNSLTMSSSGNANVTTNDFSIFGVFYLTANSSLQPLAVKGAAAPFINLSLTAANTVSLTYQPADTLYTIASGVVTTGWYIISAIVNRSTASVLSNYINLNGVNSGSSATSSTTTLSNSSVWTFGGTAFTGSIGELIILTITTTSTQRQLIEGYLAYKWGILLPRTHSYYNFIP